MPEDDQLLTQEQIDAMLAGGFGEEEETASGVPTGEMPVKLKPTNMEEIRAKAGTPLMKKTKPGAPPVDAGMDQVAQRLTQLEAMLESQSGSCEGHAQMKEELRTLASQIQAVNSKVDSIIASLQGTVGFGARESFVCRSCQSKGHVAARLNCTSCGEENWWGWWPPR